MGEPKVYGSARGTGRTHRMLEHALTHAIPGWRVFVHSMDSRHLALRFIDLAKERGADTHVEQWGAQTRVFINGAWFYFGPVGDLDLKSGRIPGMGGGNYLSLIDHHTAEARRPDWMLEQIHRFDK